jgi:tRNA 2-selenouridine synthase SelU
MTKFKTKKLSNNKDIIAIVDVGSYKTRVAICDFSDESIKLLGFAEKRQSTFDVINNQIKNLE